MSRPLRLLAAVVLPALLAVPAGACGGGESAQQLLKDTFGPNHPIRSGNLAVGLNLDLRGMQGVRGPVALRLSGPFSSNGKGKLPSFDFDLALRNGSSNFTAGAVSTGDRGFLKLQGRAYAVTGPLFDQFKRGYEQAAARSKGKRDAPTLQSLGIDPLDWLRDPRKAGTERVGGAETYHVTAGVVVDSLLDDVNRLLGRAGGTLGAGATRLPSQITDAQRRAIERSVRDARLDVWTGKDDKTLRRLRVTLGLDVPADVRGQARGLRSGTVVLDLTLADLNRPQSIAAPAGARPLSDLTSALGGALPGAGGKGGSGGAGAGAGTAPPAGGAAPSAASSQAYLDCVQKAGSDIQAIQKCAQALGK